MSLKSQFSGTQLPVSMINRDTYYLGIKLDANLNLLAELKLPFKKISEYRNSCSIRQSIEVCYYNSDDADSDWAELTPGNKPLTPKPEHKLTLFHVNQMRI